MPSWFYLLSLILALLLPWTISGVETTLAFCALCLLGFTLIRRRWPPHIDRLRPLLAPVALFCFSALLSNLHASVTHQAISPGALLSPLWLALVLLLPPLLIRDEVRAYQAVSILIGVGALVSLYGIAQYLTGIDLARAHPLTREVVPHSGRYRVLGLYSHPLTFAYAFAFILSFALARALYAARTLERSAAIGAAVLIEIALWLSGGRAAWLAVTVWTLVLLLLHRPWRDPGVAARSPGSPPPDVPAGPRSSLAYRLAPLLLLLAPAVMMLSSTALRERAADSVQVSARRPRLLFWQIAVQQIERAPLLGSGVGSFHRMAAPQLKRLAPDVSPPRHAHQTYLQLWVEGGLGALLGMLWLFMRWIRLAARDPGSASRKARGLTVGALGGLVTFLAGGLTQDTLGDAEVHRMLAFSCGILVAVAGSSRSPGRSRIQAQPVQPLESE